MKKESFFPIVILRTKTGFNAFSPLVDGCVVTAPTIDKAMKEIKEALIFHFEGEHLLKQYHERKSQDLLRKSFDKYGTDAVYVSMKIAA